MRCPDCDHPLVIVEYDRVEIDYCTRCRGCWLDEGELGLILTGDLYLPEQVDLVKAQKGRRCCPHCRARLRTGPLPESNVEVDACPFHHGMWLDYGELRKIIEYHAEAGVIRPLSRYLGELFECDVPTTLT